MGDFKLKDRFPQIFAITRNKDTHVDKAFLETGERRGWDVQVCRNLQDWELEENSNLLLLLSGISLGNQKDQSVWKLDKHGTFSVKSYYSYLSKRNAGEVTNVPFKQIWKANGPLTIAFFA